MAFLDKLKERTKQVREALADAVEGNRVTPEIREFRYSTCRSCEHLFSVTESCKKCGCFVGAKTWLPSQSCPIGKWLPVEIKPQNSND